MNNLTKNILTVAGAIVAIVQCILIMFLSGTVPVYVAILFTLFFAGGGIVYTRFAYRIAKHSNKIHMRRFKKFEESAENYEPSDLIVRRTRIAGIILLVIYEIFFFVAIFSGLI